MPIHDQSYRRYAAASATPLGRAWTGDRAGRHPHACSAKRVFLALLLFAWMPFVVRAVQIYVADELPAGGAMLAPTAADVPRVPRAAGLLRLLRHDLRRRRADRQRSPRQRAADLPVEAAAAHRSTSPASGGAVRVPAARHWVPAILLLLLQVMFAGSFDVPAGQPVPVPGDHASAALLQVLLATFTMLALSSLSKSSRYVAHPLRRHHFLHRRRFTALLRRSPAARASSWISLSANLDAGRRRDLPAAAALRDAVAGLAARAARPGRRCRSRCSSGGCAASRW